jgi:hypothetical protein
MFYSSVDELEKDIAGVVDFALYQVQFGPHPAGAPGLISHRRK